MVTRCAAVERTHKEGDVGQLARALDCALAAKSEAVRSFDSLETPRYPLDPVKTSR